VGLVHSVQRQSLVEGKGDPLHREGPMDLVGQLSQSRATQPLKRGQREYSHAHPGSPALTCAQGGVTLGREQGELGADFCHLGSLTLVIFPYPLTTETTAARMRPRH